MAQIAANGITSLLHSIQGPGLWWLPVCAVASAVCLFIVKSRYKPTDRREAEPFRDDRI